MLVRTVRFANIMLAGNELWARPSSPVARRSAGFRSTLLGTARFAGMPASTGRGNVPINERVLEIDPEKDQEEFARLRKRWDRLYTLRVVSNVAGLGFLISGALWRRTGDDGRIDPSTENRGLAWRG